MVPKLNGKNNLKQTPPDSEPSPELPNKSGESKNLDDVRRRYYIEQTKGDRYAAVVIITMAFVMECLMLFFYLIGPYIVHCNEFYPQYIYLYLTMVIISPIILTLLHVFKKTSKILRGLELSVLIILGFWSAVFSAFDVIYGFSAYLFIQLIIINSVIFHMRPIVHCLINLLSYLIYLTVILFGKLSIVSLFAEIVNPLFMVIASCIIIIFTDRMKFKSFLNQELINEQHQQLEFYANNDYLTRIPNRKSIIEHLENSISSNMLPISCMMIDIDYFKVYNDTYGHVMGDHCLVRLTSVMKNIVESREGLIGRYGGEEFLAVFIGKNREELIETANSIKNAVQDEKIVFSTSKVLPVVTISIGIYESEDQNVDQDTLLSNSDKALYRAKNEGRNRVSFYSENKKDKQK